LSLQHALTAASREVFFCSKTSCIVIASQGQVVFGTDFWSQHPEKEFLLQQSAIFAKKQNKTKHFAEFAAD